MNPNIIPSKKVSEEHTECNFTYMNSLVIGTDVVKL